MLSRSGTAGNSGVANGESGRAEQALAADSPVSFLVTLRGRAAEAQRWAARDSERQQKQYVEGGLDFFPYRRCYYYVAAGFSFASNQSCAS